MAEKLVGGGGRKIKPKPADRNRSPKRGISFCRVDWEGLVCQTSTLTQKAFVNYACFVPYSMCGRPTNFSPDCTGCRWNTTLATATVSEGIFTFPDVLTISLDPDQLPLTRSNCWGWPSFSLWKLPLTVWFWSCLPPFPTHYLALGLSWAARLSWVTLLHSTYPSQASPACPISRASRVLRILPSYGPVTSHSGTKANRRIPPVSESLNASLASDLGIFFPS